MTKATLCGQCRRRDVWRAALIIFLAISRAWYWRYVTPVFTVDVDADISKDTSKDAWMCIGWRQAKECNNFITSIINISVPILSDASCDTPIPKYAAGNCELETPNGTKVYAIHKSCQYNHHPKAKLLTCHMAYAFSRYREQARAYREEPQNNPKKRTGHAADQNQNYRGIVMSVHDDVLVSAYAVIQIIRHHNCTLPIELWSKPGELSNTKLLQELQKDKGIRHRHIQDYSITGFMSKPYSLYYSAFDQVMLLDADTIPIRDPTYLFDTPQFGNNGAIFFPDYWSPHNTVFHITKHSLLWELLGITFVDEFEMESGQLLVDKTKSKDALDMLMFLARTYHLWIGPLWLAWGDKDLFRFAWRMTNTNFHYIQQPPSTAGFTTNNVNVCGVTLLQHDPGGDPIFLHRNTVKLKDHSSLERVWTKQQTFVGENALEQYIIRPSPVQGRKIKCYHPTKWSSQWFQVKDLTGSDIEALEEALLIWAKNALRISEL